MSDINDASVYDDNYTLLSKIRNLKKIIKEIDERVTELENEGGGGGGDVSNKQDRLYGLTYNQETGEWVQTPLNDKTYALDLVQEPDENGEYSGDALIQIPSLKALDLVYAEALIKGGSGDLPIASASTLGGIKVGDNLTIEEDGTLNAQAGGGGSLSPASASTLGGIKIGDNFYMSSDVLKLNTLTADIEEVDAYINGNAQRPFKNESIQYQTVHGRTKILPYVEVTSVQITGDQTTTIGITPAPGQSGSQTELVVPYTIRTGMFKTWPRLFKGTTFEDTENALTGVSSGMDFEYDGDIGISFTDANNHRWSLAGSGRIRVAWGYEDGIIENGEIDLTIVSLYDQTERARYIPDASDHKASVYANIDTSAPQVINYKGYYPVIYPDRQYPEVTP